MIRGRVKIDHFSKKLGNKAKELFVEGRLYFQIAQTGLFVIESACNERDPSSIPGLGRSTGEGIGYLLHYSWASLMSQLVKNLPAMWETWV